MIERILRQFDGRPTQAAYTKTVTTDLVNAMSIYERSQPLVRAKRALRVADSPTTRVN